jgi:hypothetical protein
MTNTILVYYAALGPGVYSASNRNEYQKQKNKIVSGETLSKQCGILNISQPYRPPRPVMGIALLFTFTIKS